MGLVCWKGLTGEVRRAGFEVAGNAAPPACLLGGNEVLVLTGASGSRRPTWKVRFTQTGTYRGTSAL
jgi:hypothetical protein